MRTADLACSLFEHVAALLDEASRTADLDLRAVYCAEARATVEIARGKLANLGTLIDAQVAEIARLERLVKEAR